LPDSSAVPHGQPRAKERRRLPARWPLSVSLSLSLFAADSLPGRTPARSQSVGHKSPVDDAAQRRQGRQGGRGSASRSCLGLWTVFDSFSVTVCGLSTVTGVTRLSSEASASEFVTDVYRYLDTYVVCENRHLHMKHSVWSSTPEQVTDLMTGRNGSDHEVVLDIPGSASWKSMSGSARGCRLGHGQ